MNITKEKILSDLKNMAMIMFTKEFIDLSKEDQYKVFATVIKGYISENWLEQNGNYRIGKEKQVYYFSLEFLLGKMMCTNIINLGLEDICTEAMDELNLDFKEFEKYDAEPGLGNGGLGRLAACFLDSMASIGIPGHGCGIRYDYGLFEQKIINGEQIEGPDNWLKNGFVWETKKSHQSKKIKFYGNITLKEIGGYLTPIHTNYETILAVPYDVPIVGYKNEVVNNLRLWKAQIEGNDFDFNSFSYGTFSEIDEKKRKAEAISKLLYPDDTTENGKLLRLKQEYFFVSAGLQSIVEYNSKKGIVPNEFPNAFSIQINDTHSAFCVAEFMRILIDEKKVYWDDAWEITKQVMSYTNHTSLTETMEKWEIDKVQKLIPRVYMIIEEINRRFCEKVYQKYNNWDRVMDVAIIKDRVINMAHLAVVGSHSINGVSKLHTEILTKKVLKNFYELYPERFNNKTNGITHRRWLLKSNKALTILIDEVIGSNWKNDPTLLEKLSEFSEDKNFFKRLEGIKLENKKKLAEFIWKETGIEVNINSIFDTHAKRMHGYKRQLMNILHIIYLYREILENKDFTMYPKTFIFSAKAAPGYYLAKRIIKLINSVGKLINDDERVNKFIKVVFIPNYSVSKAQIIIPGSDLSEQISTVGMEASGTSNMKFMMNGALTIGTLDGANIEIKEAVGEENIFIFGLKYEELKKIEKIKSYDPIKILKENPKIEKVVKMLRDGTFGEDFSSIYSHLIDGDRYFVLKDFNSYLETHKKIDDIYRDRDRWNSMVVKNIAKSGNFSSDNTIRKYAKDIWKI
ncbi:MAG: glycogen phosphorylase [Fusobacteriia bacterium 4572_74]|nr:MAG: glycogen phosphorylase [Fusobacteriia bacterium 4572_74]